jgi:predicted dehydrogenase
MNLIEKADYMPGIPDGLDIKKYGIGLIGCGTIANQAHLPAYQKYGIPVVACCDVNEEAARATAERFNIPFWTTNIQDFLEKTEIKIIDMAVHPNVRMDLLKEIAKNPRPVLCQKPLALDLKQAKELGDFAKENNIILGVNQQARWAPGHKALKHLLDQGLIGNIYNIHHVMRSFQDQPGWWWTTMKHFNILDHGIHYIDLTRYFSQSPYVNQGEWERVHCTTAKLSDQNSISPLIYSANIEFGPIGGNNPLMASLQFNNIVKAKTSHSYTWWVDGDEGSIWGQQDKLFISLAKTSSLIQEIRLDGKWFPDGFAGSMIDFITAIDQQKKPPVTPEDNYNTVALTTGMVVSSEEGRVVERAEILRGDKIHV